VAKSANAMVSNTIVRKDLWVQFPPAAPFLEPLWPSCRAAPPHPDRCVDRVGLGPSYTYLLGTYLGDGMLTQQPKHVWKLRVVQDARYLALIRQCAATMNQVSGNKVGYAKKVGCVEIFCHWKHWICVFPQHGPGRKHERTIELDDWQSHAIRRFPHQFIAGLIHSDGCRVTNSVVVRGKRYEYPRYFFTNRSDDIRDLFRDACQLIGVESRPSNHWSISVAKRESVALLDNFIAPKR
jgi:hypothetical protein